MKGNEAIAEAALRAGCRFFAGYPITPQNEIPEYMSKKIHEVGGTFVQGESEIASVNMIYGAAATGTRAMTSSSSPGISLKAEGISYLAAAKLPSVIVSVMRGGPGLGSIQPAQQDYLQATKAMGNGGFKLIVLAPATIQESVDLTYKAFELADRDRNPVVVLTDGVTGSMMEPVVLPSMIQVDKADKKWAVSGAMGRDKNFIAGTAGIHPEQQEEDNIKSKELYERWQREDVRVEEFMTGDADIVIAAYGITARIAKSAIKQLREQGIKIGLIRPITVSPFPYENFKNLDPNKVKKVIVVEMSIPSQMIDDVRLGLEGNIPTETFGRSGGVVISDDEIVDYVKRSLDKGGDK